jgi:hypothetical protein
MGHELITPSERVPAINPERLRLPGGEYANKKTLQQLAFRAGLPVPEILTPAEMLELLDEGERKKLKDPETFYRQNLSANYEFYVRGYNPHPVDMWAVDMYSTASFYEESMYRHVKAYIEASDNDPVLKKAFSDNFGITKLPKAECFIQRRVRGECRYISVWNRGRETFLTFQIRHDESSVNWMHFNGDYLVRCSPGFDFFTERDKEKILSITDTATRVFNDALNGTGTKPDFEFKHDILMSSGEYYLIQSRIASEYTTEEKIKSDQDKINTLKKRGILEIDCEIGKLGNLKNHNLDTPFILHLTNNEHFGIGSMENIQLKNMAGLELPYGLSGGILAHQGYNVIAYALYWGLPIVFR